jgi:hypothetical protein
MRSGKPDRKETLPTMEESSGTTRLKMWAFRTLKNTISNILSDRFTHVFSRVVPVGWAMPTIDILRTLTNS